MTPRAAVAKFASNGRDKPKKDLGLMCMSYGNIYVARAWPWAAATARP